MKKVLYLLFGIVLLLPFAVKAEDYFSSVDSNCSSSPDSNEVVCTLSLSKQDNNPVKLTIELPNGNVVNTDTIDSIVQFNNGEAVKAFTFNTLPAATTQDVTVTVVASVNDQEVQKIPIEFTVFGADDVLDDDDSVGDNSNPTSSANNSNTKTTTKTTSKGVTNPNTADANVLLMSSCGVLLVFAIGLSIKKLKVNK